MHPIVTLVGRMKRLLISLSVLPNAGSVLRVAVGLGKVSTGMRACEGEAGTKERAVTGDGDDRWKRLGSHVRMRQDAMALQRALIAFASAALRAGSQVQDLGVP